MARNWLVAFRPASFRGVSFKVDAEQAEGSRRLSVSPIAYAESSVIEDMGRNPRIMSLTAYVAGDSADAEAIRFTAALDQKGPAILVMPMLGPVRARVQSWRLAREKNRAGFVAFDVGFIEEGLGSVPFGSAAGAGPVAELMAAGKALLTAALGVALRGQARASDAGEALAAQTSGNRLASVVTASTLGAVPARAVSAAVETLASAAASPIDGADAYAAALVDGWRLAALQCDPASMADALGVELLSPQAGVVGMAEASVMTCALAVAACGVDYRARQDASRARAALSAAAAPVIAAAGGLGGDVFAWVSSVTGEAALRLSRTAASRAPLVRVETKVSLSAVRAAYDLYGDANRAGEIVTRNRVGTPAFMPTAFEALAQ